MQGVCIILATVLRTRQTSEVDSNGSDEGVEDENNEQRVPLLGISAQWRSVETNIV